MARLSKTWDFNIILGWAK